MKVIFFTAPWCAPCRPVARTLAELGVRYEAVDVEARPEEGARYGVLTLPTVVVERDGEVVARLEGVRRRRDYEAALREVAPGGE